MVTEDQLSSWTGPSSDTEQEKQERTEKMILAAINAHDAFHGFSFAVYAKGSYANNTNVKADSDVDTVVECQEVEYWQEFEPAKGGHPSGNAYEGTWTPKKCREEVRAALGAKFPGSVESGSVAFRIDSTTSRVDADVVPCFSYKMYFADGTTRSGTKVFKTDGSSIVNYPKLQLENGRAKNIRTKYAYKKTVRILKRLENVLVKAGLSEELPSYLMECLIYACPDENFDKSTWREVMQACLADIYNYCSRALKA